MVSSSLPSDSISVRSRMVATVPYTGRAGLRCPRRAPADPGPTAGPWLTTRIREPVRWISSSAVRPDSKSSLRLGASGSSASDGAAWRRAAGGRRRAGGGPPSADCGVEPQQFGGLVVVHHHLALGVDQDHALTDRMQHRFVVGEELGQLFRAPAAGHPAQVPSQQPGRRRSAGEQGQADGQQRRQPAGERDVHRPDRHARGHERPHLAVGILDRGDGADRGAEGAGGDFGEDLAIEGGVDGADIRLAQFLIARVGPPRAVRGHDRDEIRVGVVHDLQGIRLQQGRGIGGARRRQDEGGCRPRRWRCRPSGVRPRRRRGRARPRTRPCQRWPSGPPRTADWPQTACGRCSSAGSSTPSMTNMNARVMRVTFSSMMGIHARTRRERPTARAAAKSSLSKGEHHGLSTRRVSSTGRRSGQEAQGTGQVPLPLHRRHRRRDLRAPSSVCCSPRSANPSSRSATASSNSSR